MMDRGLSEETKKVLLTAGAVLVGIGDISEVANCPYPVGVAVAVPVPADIVKSLENAPTKEYYDTYHFLNDKLDKIIDIGKDFLTSKGYHVMAQTKKAVKLDRTQWISPFIDVHKCYETQKRIMFENTGIDCDLCGKCFAMCTYTQIYLKKLSGGVKGVGKDAKIHT